MSTPLTQSFKSAPGRPIRVLIVDDSAVVRQILSRELARDPLIQVVGTAPDPYVAREKIIELEPDVLTLDVEMPRMDGITFLKKLMLFHPMPVIVLSSLTATGTQTALDALAAGATDVLCKPGSSYSVNDMGGALAERVKIAATTRIRRPTTTVSPKSEGLPGLSFTTDKIFAVGASTGGVAALTDMLGALPADAPGTVIVQHMPAKFTTSFAQRLNGMCKIAVKEAEHGDTVIPGRALLAPGGRHMVIRRSGARYHVELSDAPAVFHQRPSVELLFDSVATHVGRNAVGALLTGMGADGAKGLLRMRSAGGRTIAQDETSCVVFGMPMEAIKCGAAEVVVPLSDVARTMLMLVREMESKVVEVHSIQHRRIA